MSLNDEAVLRMAVLDDEDSCVVVQAPSAGDSILRDHCPLNPSTCAEHTLCVAKCQVIHCSFCPLSLQKHQFPCIFFFFTRTLRRDIVNVQTVPLNRMSVWCRKLTGLCGARISDNMEELVKKNGHSLNSKLLVFLPGLWQRIIRSRNPKVTLAF